MAKNITIVYFFILTDIDNYQYSQFILLVRKETHSTCLLNLKDTYYSNWYDRFPLNFGPNLSPLLLIYKDCHPQ